MSSELAAHPFEAFDEVRIINLVDRPDRRREMIDQLRRLGGMPSNTDFFEARRPESAGSFPSVGTRGCFESHLSVLRAARDSGTETLLLMEDDFDFTREGLAAAGAIFSQLSIQDWSIFYGAHLLGDGRRGLFRLSADEPVLTASFVAFKRRAIVELVDFLEAMLKRPAGSPDYGPMHVDGAYTVFRLLNPEHATFAAFPSLGRQRSSPSDITPGNMILDRWAGTRKIATVLRKAYNWLRRH